VRRDSPGWGTILTTPKPGWEDVDVVGALAAALKVPIALDTDVSAAAIGEWRHGAARGLKTFVYVTVGTGIGGGVFADGRPVHGLLHPEVGHMLVPHDRSRDPFPGCCPFHGDCLEGLASGTAMRERWGKPGEELTDPEAWDLEAEYLALGLANLVMVLSAERIVLGGGVGRANGLIERVNERLSEALAAYVPAPEVVNPGLGPRSGLIGAIELGRGLL
jgi:fructokinase